MKLKITVDNLECFKDITVISINDVFVFDRKAYIPNIEETTKETVKEFKLSKNSLAKLEGVHPRLVDVIKEAIKTSPYDFVIVQGLRSAEYQNKLYQKGRSTKGSIVTNCDGYIKKSNHQAKSDGFGYAIDFGIYDTTKDGNIDWNSTQKYIDVANHILEIGRKHNLKLESGAFWKSFKDYPHIELKGVL